MSQENVEIVRRAFEAFSERDRDTWLALCDPTLEASPSGDWPETATVRGREAVWDFFLQAEDPWEPGTYELGRGDRRGTGPSHRQSGTRDARQGQRSDGAIRLLGSFLVSRGKLIRVEWFPTRIDALKAVGLEE